MRVATSAETAASFRAAYLARQERRRIGRPWQPPRFWDAGEITCLREMMLDQVHRLTPRGAGEIYRRTVDDFGSCDAKRLQRALRWLAASGRVVRVPKGYLLAPRRGGRA